MARYCENCGAELSPTAKFCPECGFDLTAKTAKEPVKQPPDAASPAAHTGSRKKYAYIAVAVLIAVLLFIHFFSPPLFGDSKTAYDIIVESAPNFKNPSSIRLVSGTVSSDGTTLYCGLTAENSFGGSGTDYYWLFDGMAYSLSDISETPSILEKATDALNIPAINRRLVRHFS